MAGQKVFVMRERMDEVLRKLGIPVPANTTPGKAMQMFAAAPRTASPSSMAWPATTSPPPHATLSAQAETGPYYFFAVVRTPNGSLIWDVPANLAAGDNTVTLTASNAENVY